MQKIFFKAIILFLVSIGLNAQNYQLRIVSEAGAGYSFDECTIRSMSLSISTSHQDAGGTGGASYRGTSITGPNNFEHTGIFSADNPIVSVTTRNAAFFTRISCTATDLDTYPITLPCTSFIRTDPYDYLIDDGLRIEVTPVVDIKFTDGVTGILEVKDECESGAIGIEATAGFVDPDTVYNWQFLDDITTATPTWRNITNHTGSSNIDLSLTDLFSNAADRISAVNRNILIRINPNCIVQEEEPSNVLSVLFLRSTPDFAIPAYSQSQPTCSDSNDAGFTLFFDRQFSTGERMNINLINTADNRPVGSNDGITSLVSESNGTFSYTWRTPSGGSPLGSGNYRAEISGFISGATITCDKDPVNIRITAPTAVSFTATKIRDEVCNNQNNGQIRITASGGAGGYQYRLNTSSWQALPSGGIINGLTHTTYQVSVRDSRGCLGSSTVTNSISINEATQMNHSFRANPVTLPSAPGVSDGRIRVGSVSGGTSIINGAQRYYDYRVLTTTPNITGRADATGFDILQLPVGIHRIRYTDANGCSVELPLPEITNPLSFRIENTKNPSCVAAVDGMLTIIASGGVPPYEYNWVNTDNLLQTGTDRTIEGSQGNYTVTVTDSGAVSSRTQQTNIRFDDVGDAILLRASVSPILCFDSDVNVTLTAIGGSGNYEYAQVTGSNLSWEATNEFTLPFSSGGYSFVARDTNVSVCESNTVSTGRITRPLEIGIVINDRDVVDNTVFGGNEGSITISVVNAASSYSVTWEQDRRLTSRTGTTISSLYAGTYVAIVTDSNGCIQRSREVQITEPAELLVSILGDNVDCNGGTTTLTSNVSGGSEAYTYTWFRNGSVITGAETSTHSNAIAGLYRLDVSDGYITVSSNNINITEPRTLSLSVSKTDVTCNGGSDGTLVLDPQGGTGEYSFSIDNRVSYVSENNLTDLTVGGLISDDYEVWLRDGNGCEITTPFSISITQPDALVIQLMSTAPATTVGGSNGSIDVNVIGGIEAYRYIWTSAADPLFSATTQDLENIAGGSYTLVVLDGNDCRVERTIAVREPDPLEVSLSINNPILCHGDALGELNSSVTGGFPLDSTPSDFEYEWFLVTDAGDVALNTNVSLSSLDGLEAGIYKVLVRDIAGTTAEAILEITQPEDLVVTLTSTPIHVNCFGEATGAIDVTVIGGPRDPDTGDFLVYSYSWSKVEDSDFTATTQDLVNITAGTYELVVIDDNVCTTSLVEAVVITQPEAILEIYDVIATDLTGYQTGNGSISLEVRGGTPPYEYQWINIDEPSYEADSQDIENLVIGQYELVVIDAKGCSVQLSQDITEPNRLEVAILPLSLEEGIQCFGEETVIPLQTTTVGGVPPYRYEWYDISDLMTIISTDPQMSDTVTMGTYRVNVIDNNGNTENDTYEVTEPTMLEITENVTDLLCNGDEDGIIDITVNGGVEPYVYNWSNGETTEDIDRLRAGNYTVVITDANLCIIQKVIEVSQPSGLFVNGNIVRLYPSVSGASDGSITVNIGGGTLPYTYEWRDTDNIIQASTTNILDNIGIDTYGVTITDANGCVLEIPDVDLFEPPALKVSIERVNVVSCLGSENGSISAIVEGGAPFNAAKQYVYQWFDADSNTPVGTDRFLLENIGAGNYYVIVSDAINTSVTSNVFELGEPDLLELGLEADFVFCGDGNDWTINAQIEGGTSPYRYIWSNGEVTSSISNITLGNYGLIIIDAQGCQTNANIDLVAPPVISVVDTIINPTCFEGGDGSVELSISGGVAPYSYEWNNGITESGIFNLSAGNYQVIITDAKGCAVVHIYEVIDPAPIVVDLGSDITLCKGQVAELDATIDDPNAIYSWTSENGFRSNDPNVVVYVTGIYQVNVLSGDGCTANGSIFVEATSNEIAAHFLTSTQVFVGQEFVIVDNSVPFPDSKEWQLPNEAIVSFSDENYVELHFEEAGEYEVTLFVERGLCSAFQTKKIVVLEKEFDDSDDAINSRENLNSFIDFNLYPNPSIGGDFSIDIELSEAANVSLKLLSMIDNVVLDSRGDRDNDKYNFIYNIRGLPSGIYFLSLEVSNGMSRVYKLVIN